MGGIFYSYRFDGALARGLRVGFVLLMLFSAVFDGVSYTTAFVFPFFGYLLLLGFDSRLSRFIHIMPIKPSKIVLVAHLHTLLTFFIGCMLGLVLAYFSGLNMLLAAKVMLLNAALSLTTHIAEVVPDFRGRYYLMPLAFAPALIQMELVFGLGATWGLIRQALGDEPLIYHYIFAEASPVRWLLLVAISAAAFVGGYFVAVANYKKRDYSPPDFF